MEQTIEIRHKRGIPVNVIKKRIDECGNDEVLAADIFTFGGKKLLSANTVMNDYLRHHLRLNNVTHATVYVDTAKVKGCSSRKLEFQKHYKAAVLGMRDVFLDMSAGKKLDYHGVKEISDIILSHKDSSQFACMSSLVGQIHAADQYTYTHCVDVGFYSMFIAKWLGLPDNEISEALQGGLLHDLGKTKIPSSILNKPGRLTDDEYECMKSHPIEGYKILLDIPEIDTKAKQAVLLHHERLDSSGYPLGITPHNLISRIIAVADVYDAITTDRVYKKGDSPFKAFEFFLHKGISMFDWRVSNALISNVSAALIGTEVILESGQTAQIVYIPPCDPLKLIVSLGSEFTEVHYNGKGYQTIPVNRAEN